MKRIYTVLCLFILLFVFSYGDFRTIKGYEEDFNHKKSLKLQKFFVDNNEDSAIVLIEFYESIYDEYNLTNSIDENEISNLIEESDIDSHLAAMRYQIELRNKYVLGNLVENIGNDITVLYQSKYTPYLLVEIDKQGLMKLAKMNEVRYISFHSKEQNYISHEELAQPSISYIHANYIYESSSQYREVINANNLNTYFTTSDSELDGSGVKVGIMEDGKFYTVVRDDLNIAYEQIDSYTYIDEGIEKTRIIPLSKHKGDVALLVGGDDDGIAPGAEIVSLDLYITNSDDTLLLSEMMGEFDEYISKNVNIINCSYELDENDTYDDLSIYLDNLISTTKVTIVAAAGNSGNRSAHSQIFERINNSSDFDNIIQNIALTSNVITVGSTTMDGQRLSDFSSYASSSLMKPTIVAPGGSKFTNLDNVPSDKSCNQGYAFCKYNVVVSTFSMVDGLLDQSEVLGTSFSAPLVSGAVAIMMEYDPMLKLHPERVIALLVNGASTENLSVPKEHDDYANQTIEYSIDYLTFNFASGLSYEAGAGLINLHNTLDAIMTGEHYSYIDTTTNNNQLHQSFYVDLNSGVNYRLVHSYLRNQDISTFTGTSISSMSNYNIRVVYEISPNNNVILYETSSDNSNIEILHFSVTSSDQYRVDVYIEDKKIVYDDHGVPKNTNGYIIIIPIN